MLLRVSIAPKINCFCVHEREIVTWRLSCGVPIHILRGSTRVEHFLGRTS